MSTSRWRKGLYRVVLANGADFTVKGRLRVTHDHDGFITDIEIDSPELVMCPPLGDISAVLRVADPAGEAG